ncbi:MAG TPA: hypothetical protein PLG17_10190 [Thermodesulfobacteriota bacterium]|nr:hypothetical protein [Thermodesulfobacteriota bacterium]HNU71434.1 hypothetical protein [Thermodesulfobacteriota bacterium]HQO78867.1 hypothetical protein [Thermodesulfobacteriota bacterium]
MIYQQRLFLLPLACLMLSGLLLGCAGPLVRTDLQTFQQHPEQFKGKQVVITASLEEIYTHRDAYSAKKVEITGTVTRKGFWGPPDWDFFLTDNQGRTLRCYERTYRVDAWIIPVMAIKRAERENSTVTVVGKLEQDLDIELDWFEYQGQHYDTDHLPASVPLPFM